MMESTLFSGMTFTVGLSTGGITLRLLPSDDAVGFKAGSVSCFLILLFLCDLPSVGGSGCNGVGLRGEGG
jgi:hypothetical protein